MADGEGDVTEIGRGSVYLVGDVRVMLDSDVAKAFGTETKRVNEAVSRNAEKFTQRHCFRLDDEQTRLLRSQDATTNAGSGTAGGRGGSQYRPMVYTLHGVARLATILNTPEALRATDLIIDTFLTVHEQITSGRTTVAIPNPSDFEPSPVVRREVDKLKRRMLKALNGLLDTLIAFGDGVDPEAAARTLGGTAFQSVVERLRTQGLANAKLEADTALVLAQAEEIRAKARKTDAEAHSIDIDNLDKKIAMVRKLIALSRELEPVAFVEALDVFEAGQPRLLTGPGAAKAKASHQGR